MKKQLKFKPDALYLIEFDDHASGVIEPMIIRAVGWVIDDKPNYIHISSWIVQTTDETVKHSNLESFVLLKSCIRSRQKLI